MAKDIKLDDDLFEDVPFEEETSTADAALRGAGQGLTLGFLDELKSMLGTMGASPSQVVAEPQKAIETEKKMMQDYESNLEEERAIDDKLREESPYAYTGAEIASGILPGLLSGGAGIAGNIIKEGTKQGLKEGIKEGAKLGAKYGAVSGAGYSDADTPLELAEDVAVDTATGATLGAGLPILGKGAKEALKGTKKTAEAAFDLLPKSEQIKASYKYGTQGKSLDQDVIDEDLMTLGKEVYKNIKKKKKDNNLSELTKQLDELGYKVNTKEAVEEAVEDIKKLGEGDLLGLQNQKLLPKLEELLGKSKQVGKLANRAEKKSIKKEIESGGLKSDIIEEGVESGRPVVTNMDTETGKISAIVGDVENQIKANLEEMPISEVEALRRQLNDAIGLASGQGSAKDPVVRRAKDLAKNLKQIVDDEVKAKGNKELIDRRSKFSDMFTAEELLGIDGVKAVRKDIDDTLKSKSIASQLGFNRSFDKRVEADEAARLLGDDVVTPEIKDQFDLMKTVNEIVGRGESSENISRAGIYQMAAGIAPNIAGRSVKKAKDIASKVASPVAKVIDNINLATDDQLSRLSSSMSSSDNSAIQTLGGRLEAALSQKGNLRNASIWSLSQNPAFREASKRFAKEMESDMQQDLGIEPELSDDMFEDIPFEEEGVEDNYRKPSAVENIEEGLEHILDVEAGYQAQKEDTGNFIDGKLVGTNRGITPEAYRAYYGKAPSVEDMKNLTKEQAIEIYKKDYVGEPGFSKIEDPNLQTAIVDYGVNSGPVRAIKAVQRLVGAKPDGILGPKTLELINNYEGDLRLDLMNERREFIKRIDNPKYEKGWLNRIDHMEKLTTPEEIESIEKDIDRVNQQQSSGESEPINQLDDLLGKINEMNIDQESKDMLEDEAIAMEGFGDGLRLKQMIRELSGQS